MRRNATVVALIFTIVTLSDSWTGVWLTGASEPAPTPARMAVIDLTKALQGYPKFRKAVDALRRDVEQAERDLKGSVAQMKAAAASLNSAPNGSAEYKAIESKMERGRAEITATVERQKAQFFEREAKMYFDAYQEVTAEVTKYAEARGINFVMRFTGEPYDAKDPQALQKELNKIVFYHQGIDITDDIIALVNSKPGEKDVAKRNNDKKEEAPKSR
jgi:Skp family chaperone for outer membrane proteins